MRRVYHHEIEAMNLAQVEETAIEIWKQSRKCDCDDWGGLLDACLSRRQDLLNETFQLTDAEFERFKVVSAMLAEKTEMIARNTHRIYTQAHEQMKSGEWCDFTDFNIESSIRVVYEDYSSVFSLPGEPEFNNFGTFAEILADFYDGNDIAWPYYDIMSYDADRTPDEGSWRRCDDLYYNENEELDGTWHDWVGVRFPRLLEVPIYYSMHRLYDHTRYSLPDIIRISELWSEVKIVWQNIENR